MVYINRKYEKMKPAELLSQYRRGMRLLKPFLLFGLKSTRLHRSSSQNFKMSLFAPPSPVNPLLAEWTTPYSIPPFTEIKPEMFEPAFEVALKDHIEEVTAIAQHSDEPSFENTLVALDKVGGLLTRIQKVFYNLCSSCSSAELQAVQMKLAGPLAAHMSAIYTLPGRFLPHRTLVDP